MLHSLRSGDAPGLTRKVYIRLEKDALTKHSSLSSQFVNHKEKCKFVSWVNFGETWAEFSNLDFNLRVRSTHNLETAQRKVENSAQATFLVISCKGPILHDILQP